MFLCIFSLEIYSKRVYNIIKKEVKILKLKELRKNKGVSQEEVANALGVSFRAYQNYEYGQREPNIEMLNKIADYFGTSVDYLLGRDTSEKPVIDLLAAQFDMSALEQEIIKGYLDLPENMRDNLMDFLERAVRKVQSGIPTPMIARSSDDRPPGVMMLTPEQKKRLDEAPDETQNPDNDI